MCGLVGIVGLSKKYESNNLKQIINKMSKTLLHRGPDRTGIWIDSNVGVALGHQRLSILDLSSHGNQPMLSRCGRYVMVFNGEIYNYEIIRSRLEQSSPATLWCGHSDTEVVLAAISRWGVIEAVKHFVGMFAIALWDKQEQTLVLLRDRLGEKPLYYGWVNKLFLFGSELKALKAHPEWCSNISRDSLALLMRHNYIPAPYSIYKGIYKLLPGTMLVMTKKEIVSRQLPPLIEYWSIRDVIKSGKSNPFKGNIDQAVGALDNLLNKIITGQMTSDVPLGAFLSGGIDSSTIVSLMQANSTQAIKTFTIGFGEQSFNEAKYAAKIAQYLGTDHTELYVTPEEAISVIPKIPQLFDEPFSDSSQIPTYIVSKLARQSVTVSLSGDGGDELFGGYNRYFWGRSIWQKIGWMPQSCRVVLQRLITALPPHLWDSAFGIANTILTKKYRINNSGDKLHKLAEILNVDNPDLLYLNLVSHSKSPTTIVLNSTEPQTVLSDKTHRNILSDFRERMMYFDSITYLPDDILVKVDRASMGVSLESRIPFLDHRLVEFAWRLPLSMKIRNGQGKYLLRQLLYKYVPKELVDRPKMGFGIPIGSWLKGSLRDWAEELLREKRIKEEGYFDPLAIRNIWEEHLSGKRNWQYHLWDILMFQSWHESYY